MRTFLSLIIVFGISVSSLFGTAHPPIKEGAYYGVNYTVPFAHAYRALGRLGVDRRQAIDRDVYHMARLGLNAFRLHLWDVELSDGHGNLIEEGNDHLELLDYLIAQLEKRGIAIVLTAQTNFGNGYPERNTDPNGAFSYMYAKCDVHDNPAAQAAQENYLKALVNHVNPFTGKSYVSDPDILAIEINNEPCHSGSAAQITAYIDRMASALRSAGWDKEILYNVSHNLDRIEGYYNAADIDGTTYQWYPTGLVRGSERRGNFLPMLDSYDIPWDTVKGFDKLSRVVYEYDPADVLETYLYPAATRTFRKAGFNWVTQFAYDPIDMARFNTEYQTHFLNLAYTPGKAVGMMIAAEAMRQLPAGADYGKYPADTVFGEKGQFTVSAHRNLALLNDGERYYHTNTTSEAPSNIKKLRAVAGVGSSPIVTTDGTGAYFLDRLDNGLWRLEVMPDVIITEDPFAKPSLSRTVAVTTGRPVRLEINAAKLFGSAKPLYYAALPGNGKAIEAENGVIEVKPGVYILGTKPNLNTKELADKSFGQFNNMAVSEYVAPPSDISEGVLVHTSPAGALKGQPVKIAATWGGNVRPDSIVVYPASTSFWRERNRLFKMEKDGKYTYSTEIPADALRGDTYTYRIVAFSDGKPVAYPGKIEGTPLDWDYPEHTATYRIPVISPGEPIELIRAAADMDGSEITTIPEGWKGTSYTYQAPLGVLPHLVIDIAGDADTDLGVVSKYVAPLIQALKPDSTYTGLRMYLGNAGQAKVGLVNSDGFTYTALVPTPNEQGFADIPLSDFKLDATVLAPAPYPAFLNRFFIPEPSTATPLKASEIETLTIEVPRGERIEISGVTLK